MTTFYKDTMLLCSQIYNNQLNCEDKQFCKKVDQDINHNIDLISDEYEFYYPGAKKLMQDFLIAFKNYSTQFFNLYQQKNIQEFSIGNQTNNKSYSFRMDNCRI